MVRHRPTSQPREPAPRRRPFPTAHVLGLALVFALTAGEAPFATAQSVLNPRDFPPDIPFGAEGDYRAIILQGGPTMIDEDLYLVLDAGLILELENFGLYFDVPMRLMLADRSPKSRDEDTYGGVIRKGDWDTPSDYAKLLHYIRFGKPGKPFYGRFGELVEHNLGHGSIVFRYYNNTDINRYMAGLILEGNSDFLGGGVFLNNLMGPTLMGGRIYANPAGFFMPDSALAGLRLGFSTVVDAVAPTGVAQDIGRTRGDVDGDSFGGFSRRPSNAYATNDTLTPKPRGQQALAALGWDFAFDAVKNETLEVIPYADINKLVNYGTGFHQGAFTNVFFGGKTAEIRTKAEWRAMQADYLPGYFDAYYEIHRYQFPAPRQSGYPASPSKLEFLKLEKAFGEGSRLGWYGEFGFRMPEWFGVGVAYEDAQGRDNSGILLYGDVPALEFFKFSVAYHKKYYDKASEIFETDERALFMARARLYLIGPLFLDGAFFRTWQLNPASGAYEPVNEWTVRAGAQIEF